MMGSKGNYPKVALFQVSELLHFAQSWDKMDMMWL